MSEVEQSGANQPDDRYEPPSVERIETEDSPAAVAALLNSTS
jgi:hypothetical protein